MAAKDVPPATPARPAYQKRTPVAAAATPAQDDSTKADNNM